MAAWRTFWSDPALRARLYLGAVMTLGLAGLILAATTRFGAVSQAPGHLRVTTPVLWLLCALVVLGEARPVLSRRATDGASLGLAFATALYAVDCWQDAVLAQGFAMLLVQLGRRHVWERVAFNVAQQLLCYAVGGVLFTAITARGNGSA